MAPRISDGVTRARIERAIRSSVLVELECWWSCSRSAVRSMVSVCSHSGANNIRSSVLVELDLEEEYQRVNGAHRAGLDM